MKNKGKICKRCNGKDAKVKELCISCYYAGRKGMKINKEKLLQRNYIVDDRAYITDQKGNKWEIDLEDFEKCKNQFWNDNGSGYAKSMKKGYLHKYICPKWKIIDHIDRNPYNCKKDNLRDGGNGLNGMNKKTDSVSGYKGVHKMRDKWQARVKRKYLGTFKTPDHAREKVIEYAKQNKLLEFYII